MIPTRTEQDEREHVEEAIRRWREAEYRKDERKRVWSKRLWIAVVLGVALVAIYAILH